MGMMTKAGFAGAMMFAFLANSAAADLRITTYDTIKAPDKVRSCIVKVLQASADRHGGARPTITPLSTSSRNDGWAIDFRLRRQRASIIVLAAAAPGSRVVYPTQIAMDDEALAQRLEDCG